VSWTQAIVPRLSVQEDTLQETEFKWHTESSTGSC